MFKKADDLAKALVKAGVKKGDEIPVCLAQTPEVAYIMLALNKIGAKMNSFGPGFNKEYLKRIMQSCSSKIFISSDNMYGEIKDVVECIGFEKEIIVSLADSLPENPRLTDEYESSLSQYYSYDNKRAEFKKQNKEIMSLDEFIETAANEDIEVKDEGKLDDEFLITYTSGSTKKGLPKALIHKNRSLIVSGTFHDPELSGNPKLKGMRGIAYTHAESNTGLITGISDNLMQGWSVAFEPEYDLKKSLDCLFINKPNYINTSSSFLIESAKQYLLDKRFHENGKGRKLPFLLAIFAVGEGLSPGEEKFINIFLRKARAGSGVKINGLSMPFTTVSIGGGDCEHGGIYYTLWKSFYEKLFTLQLRKKPIGLIPVPYAHVSAFRPTNDGLYEECNYGEYGIIAANSATSLTRYKENHEATKSLVIQDTNNRNWITANVYGFIDNLGTVHVKDRIGNELTLDDGTKMPLFVIADEILKDTKNIMSCSVVRTNEEIPVAHVQFQPFKKLPDAKILEAMMQRLEKNISREIAKKIRIKLYPIRESLPLAESGKRSILLMENMGLDDTFKIGDNEGKKLKYVPKN